MSSCYHCLGLGYLESGPVDSDGYGRSYRCGECRGTGVERCTRCMSHEDVIAEVDGENVCADCLDAEWVGAALAKGAGGSDRAVAS